MNEREIEKKSSWKLKLFLNLKLERKAKNNFTKIF